MLATPTSENPEENGTVEILPDANGKLICPYCTGPLYEPGATNELHCRVCETIFDPVS